MVKPQCEPMASRWFSHLAGLCPSDKKTPASETVLIRQVEPDSLPQQVEPSCFNLEGQADLALPV